MKNSPLTYVCVILWTLFAIFFMYKYLPGVVNGLCTVNLIQVVISHHNHEVCELAVTTS